MRSSNAKAAITGRVRRNVVRIAGLALATALAIGLDVLTARVALPSSAAPGSEDPWTVLTMAPDGSWGTATDSSSSRAIARALADCKTMSGLPIGCGAKFTAIRAGWSLGLRCGTDNILVAARTLADAERAALQRETELRERYVPGLPRCLRVVTVDPDGTADAPSLRAAGRAVGAGAELLIWKTITVGVHRGVNAYRKAFDAAGVKVGETADEIIGRPVFSYEPVRKSLDLVLLSVTDLGLPTDSVSLAEVYRRAAQLGLEPCPGEAALQLRLDYRDQPLGEFLNIAMDPVKTYDGVPTTLTLGNGGAGLVLIGRDGRSDFLVPANWRFVFALPRLEQAARPAAINSRSR